jgi:hypothetical protein
MSATSNSALGNSLIFVGKPQTVLPRAAAVSNAADGKSIFRVYCKLEPEKLTNPTP